MSTVASPASASLDYRAAMASPCDSCHGAPCCTYLPLDSFRVQSLGDLDYVVYLLNFADIEVCAGRDGVWSSYLVRPCGHLTADGRCGVHATPEQPHVCQQYNPFACWYRPALVPETLPPGEPATQVRLDRDRLDWIIARTEFDTARVITVLPTWNELVAYSATASISPIGADQAQAPADQAGADPIEARDAGEPATPVVASAAPVSAPAAPNPAGHDPCAGCAAYCCHTVLFPVDPPTSRRRLDYLRFVLGFPGVTVNVTRGEWRVAVSTECRHLVGNRCGIFGQWDRPLRCQYFDAWQCGYVPALGPQPVDAAPTGLTLAAADWPRLAEALGYDESGEVAELPDFETLAAAIYLQRAADPTPTGATLGSPPEHDGRRLLPIAAK